jgi:hypothetical protein
MDIDIVHCPKHCPTGKGTKHRQFYTVAPIGIDMGNNVQRGRGEMSILRGDRKRVRCKWDKSQNSGTSLFPKVS